MTFDAFSLGGIQLIFGGSLPFITNMSGRRRVVSAGLGKRSISAGGIWGSKTLDHRHRIIFRIFINNPESFETRIGVQRAVLVLPWEIRQI